MRNKNSAHTGACLAMNEMRNCYLNSTASQIGREYSSVQRCIMIKVMQPTKNQTNKHGPKIPINNNASLDISLVVGKLSIIDRQHTLALGRMSIIAFNAQYISAKNQRYKC